MKKFFTTFFVVVFVFVIAMIAITQREALLETLFTSCFNYFDQFYLFLIGMLTSIVLMIGTILYLNIFLGIKIKLLKIKEHREEQLEEKEEK